MLDSGLEGFDFADLVRRLAFTLIPMILSLSVHECAHAWSAYMLGDPTAKEAGRLTLNPQSHIDPWGTLLIPAINVLIGGLFFFGWARPTPFRPDRFRPGINRRLGSAIVAAAGPLSNLLLAVLSLTVMAILSRLHVPLFHSVQSGDQFVDKPTAVALLLYSMFTLNVALAFFNLLPFPPLDGHRLLPPQLDAVMRPFQRYGLMILFGVFFFLPAVAEKIFYGPLGAMTHFMENLFGVA